MKKLYTICLLIATVFSVNALAQNAPLNKQQTLDYIEKLFKESFIYGESLVKVVSVTLDNKILQVNLSDGAKSRNELLLNQLLMIKKSNMAANRYHIGYYFEGKADVNVLYHISAESDANRLKKAIEHLIEILKTEKSTDPFGE